MIKTSKSCDLNFASSGRDTEAKTSPRHLNFLKQLNKTTEMLYPYISGFKIHQGTQWVPRNTVTEQIGHTTIRNLGIASGPSFFFFHERKKNLMDSHPYSHETSIFTLGAPHEEVQGRQTKLHPGFTMGKLVQPSPGIFELWTLKLSSSTSYLEYQAGGGKGLVDLVNQLTLERCQEYSKDDLTREK